MRAVPAALTGQDVPKTKKQCHRPRSWESLGPRRMSWMVYGFPRFGYTSVNRERNGNVAPDVILDVPKIVTCVWSEKIPDIPTV
jgi:hypothetical protein